MAFIFELFAFGHPAVLADGQSGLSGGDERGAVQICQRLSRSSQRWRGDGRCRRLCRVWGDLRLVFGDGGDDGQSRAA